MINIVGSSGHLSALIRELYFRSIVGEVKSLVTHFLEIKFTKTSCKEAPGYHCKYAVSFFLYLNKLLILE